MRRFTQQCLLFVVDSVEIEVDEEIVLRVGQRVNGTSAHNLWRIGGKR